MVAAERFVPKLRRARNGRVGLIDQNSPLAWVRFTRCKFRQHEADAEPETPLPTPVDIRAEDGYTAPLVLEQGEKL